MNKKMLSILFAVLLVFQGTVFADAGSKEDGTYNIPVRLWNFHSDMPSMGDAALRKTAKVELKDGQATYTIYTSQLVFGKQNMEGRVTDFFVYDCNDKEKVKKLTKNDTAKNTEKAVETSVDLGEMNTVGKIKKEVPFDTSFTFIKKAPLQNEVYVAVWVDAMDIISGGQKEDGSYEKGAGEQKATLQFDWDKAEKVADKNEAEPQTDTKDNTQEVKDSATETTTVEKLEVKDVPQNNWAYPAVNFVMQKGYFKGGSDGNFMPDDSITRGQFLTVLGRIADVDKAKFAGMSYSDVKESEYYAPYVKWSKENALCHIDGDQFMPNQALTREEMAYIMDKFIALTDKKLDDATFTGFNDDAQISDWAKDSVMNIAKKGVIKGSDGKFDPKGKFTRAQVAQVLYNIYK